MTVLCESPSRIVRCSKYIGRTSGTGAAACAAPPIAVRARRTPRRRGEDCARAFASSFALFLRSGARRSGAVRSWSCCSRCSRCSTCSHCSRCNRCSTCSRCSRCNRCSRCSRCSIGGLPSQVTPSSSEATPTSRLPSNGTLLSDRRARRRRRPAAQQTAEERSPARRLPARP